MWPLLFHALECSESFASCEILGVTALTMKTKSYLDWQNKCYLGHRSVFVWLSNHGTFKSNLSK